MHGEHLNLQVVVVFLAAAGLVVPLMQRLRINPVLGFLAVGLLIGPHGLGRLTEALPWLRYVVISDIEGTRAIAELGIVFLLFMIGLELSFERLLAMRRLVFGLGGAQVVVTGAVIAAIAYGFGNEAPQAIVIGACLALSSTAIVMRLLTDGRRLATPVGRTSFGVLLFQDLAVVPILFLVGILGAQSEGPVWQAFGIALGKAALAIALILLLGRTVIRPLFRFVGATRSRELFLAAVLLVIIATAILTDLAGLSLALGAFLAGLLLSETEYSHQIEVDIEPFNGLLLGLFFVSVGMSIDFISIARDPVWIPLSVAGLFLVKSVLLFGLATAFGQSRSVSVESALLLAQGGEFAFVVVALARGLDLVPRDTGQFILIVTSLTMLLTPLVAQLARKAGARLAERERVAEGHPAGPAEDIAGHVIIAGYGRVGQMLGSLLEANHIPHVGLDNDANTIAPFRKQGGSVYYGDASRPEFLKRAGIDRAIALAITMDSTRVSERVIAAIRKDWPELPILARARDIRHAQKLIAAGANDVVPETVEASLELAEVVLRAAGFADDAARQIVAERRQSEKHVVESQAADQPPA